MPLNISSNKDGALLIYLCAPKATEGFSLADITRKTPATAAKGSRHNGWTSSFLKKAW
jgi:hypothetical protein